MRGNREEKRVFWRLFFTIRKKYPMIMLLPALRDTGMCTEQIESSLFFLGANYGELDSLVDDGSEAGRSDAGDTGGYRTTS